MPDTKTTTATDLALIAVFAALIAAFSLTPAIPIGIGVPITLQTLAVVLAGLVLGPWRGSLATLLYLAVGFAGLPVFAGGAAGLAVLAKPSVGYLLAFPIGAAIAGFSSPSFLRRLAGAKQYLGFFLAGLAVAVHPRCRDRRSDAGGEDESERSFLPDLAFWPGDVAKMFASAIAVAVHRVPGAARQTAARGRLS